MYPDWLNTTKLETLRFRYRANRRASKTNGVPKSLLNVQYLPLRHLESIKIIRQTQKQQQKRLEQHQQNQLHNNNTRISSPQLQQQQDDDSDNKDEIDRWTDNIHILIKPACDLNVRMFSSKEDDWLLIHHYRGSIDQYLHSREDTRRSLLKFQEYQKRANVVGPDSTITFWLNAFIGYVGDPFAKWVLEDKVSTN